MVQLVSQAPAASASGPAVHPLDPESGRAAASRSNPAYSTGAGFRSELRRRLDAFAGEVNSTADPADSGAEGLPAAPIARDGTGGTAESPGQGGETGALATGFWLQEPAAEDANPPETEDGPEQGSGGLALALRIAQAFGHPSGAAEMPPAKGGLAAVARTAWGQEQEQGQPLGLGQLYRSAPVPAAPVTGSPVSAVLTEEVAEPAPAVAGDQVRTTEAVAEAAVPADRTQAQAPVGHSSGERQAQGEQPGKPVARDGQPRQARLAVPVLRKGNAGHATAQDPGQGPTKGPAGAAALQNTRQPRHAAPAHAGTGTVPRPPQPAATVEAPLEPVYAGAREAQAGSPGLTVTVMTGGEEQTAAPRPETGGARRPAAAPETPMGAGPVSSTADRSFRASVQQALPADDPDPAAGSGRSGDLVSQVVARARLLRGPGGAGTLEVQLRPASLGRVFMRLSSVPGGTLQLVLRAERSQVAEAMRQQATGLARALEGQGLRVGSIDIAWSNNGTRNGAAWSPTGWGGNSGPGMGGAQTGGYGAWPGSREAANPAGLGGYQAAYGGENAPQAAAEAAAIPGSTGWGTGGWLNVFA